MSETVHVGLHAVIITVMDEIPHVLTIRLPNMANEGTKAPLGLPFGPLDPAADRTLELALRRWVDKQTGLALGYVEQLYTFGDRDRAHDLSMPHERLLSIAYLALTRESLSAQHPEAQWQPIYPFLPWEDWRTNTPAFLENDLVPHLQLWAKQTAIPQERQERQERIDIAFGQHGATWDPERTLERYELLYESGFVPEALRNHPHNKRQHTDATGLPMASDHRRILSTALGRLRGKIKYRPVVFELLPPNFTLLRLQRTVEALAGRVLHKQNFRRLVEKAGLVESTGDIDTATGGRPAALFQFRRDVLRERPTPGVKFPSSITKA